MSMLRAPRCWTGDAAAPGDLGRRAGDTVAARAELAKLVALGKGFSSQEEVASLLKTLGS